MSNQESARVVIVGGGVIGLGVAWHLAKLGVDDVLLIERNQLASGTSWHAAGIVGPLRASMNATRLAMAADEVFPALERETGQGTGYRRTGGFWLARTADRLVELRRIAAVGEMAGLDARMVAPDAVAAAAPNLRVDDLAGALWVAEDGQANPVDVCMAYAKGARAAGVRIREDTACVGIERRDGAVRAVRLSDGTTIRCETVVNCAGAWARAVGTMAGVPVPLQTVEHMYVTTEPLDDIGARDTPLEAGLGFAVSWDKPGGFIGRDALLAGRRKGIDRRLLQFEVAGAHPLLLHDEPVYRGGTLVGHTTSGGRGFRTGLALCFAYVRCEPGTPRNAMLGGGYEIGVAGERFQLRALGRPAYDPDRARLRS